MQSIQIDLPPLEITAFLDHLHDNRQYVIPGSLIWLPHPTRAGWMVAGVKVDEALASERKTNDE